VHRVVHRSEQRHGDVCLERISALGICLLDPLSAVCRSIKLDVFALLSSLALCPFCACVQLDVLLEHPDTLPLQAGSVGSTLIARVLWKSPYSSLFAATAHHARTLERGSRSVKCRRHAQAHPDSGPSRIKRWSHVQGRYTASHCSFWFSHSL